MSDEEMIETTSVDDAARTFVCGGPEPLVPHKGKGKELCDLLRRELKVPEHTRSFSVKFEAGELVLVTCEYMPRG